MELKDISEPELCFGSNLFICTKNSQLYQDKIALAMILRLRMYMSTQRAEQVNSPHPQG